MHRLRTVSWARRAAAALALVALTGALTAFGAATPAGAPRLVVRGGPPPARAWHKGCAGKPLVALGSLAVAVTERPRIDVAVVRATWERGPLGSGARLVLLLPEGAALLEGEGDLPLPDGVASGTSTWRVQFLPDRTLDVAVRLVADVAGASASREDYARLWEAP